ncbi:MAG: hypothetical protein HOO06_03820 [Bdellovibrionaceae bacterium]|jgi:hypothetical protein|nr:hypothetical protein [Pseudobdellovibrionaceae bacterium]
MNKNNKYLFFILITLSLCSLLLASSLYARNTSPSSGRYLKRGHWLTCWGGQDERLRHSQRFNKNTEEAIVASYVPEFKGSYGFQVKDTWQEYVTKSGTDCFHCGESCSGSGENRSCSCNTCSWQELETFYRPWSHQQVSWEAQWQQDQKYREKRKEWMANGKPELNLDNSDLETLFEFDPERPSEYFLFPGEVERVRVSNVGDSWMNFGGRETINPEIFIADPRHEYIVRNTTNRGSGSLQCDDVDIEIKATVSTGKRKVTKTPNSLEFKGNWIFAETDSKGDLVREPGEYHITDIAAEYYEEQNVYDHYKNTEVSVQLVEINRNWWYDVPVSNELELGDNLSRVQFDIEAVKRGEPSTAVFEVDAASLHLTGWFESEFNLHPGKDYLLCGKILRKNNIYYQNYDRDFILFKQGKGWSEPNCKLFKYKPSDDYDLRGSGRKLRDFVEKAILLDFTL